MKFVHLWSIEYRFRAYSKDLQRKLPTVLREPRDTINSSQYLPCDMKIAYDVPERSL